ncbi:M1 family aminopeptidase [Microbacterium sp. ZW T5_45]|uniref:M1 family metallopeptidase n=1 Tax=Microbacterium sp. ZW T5_45 TaxID=3378080 RepID=UPI003852DE28
MTRSTSSPRGRRLLATSAVAALLAGSVLATALPASAADDPIDGAQTSGDAMFPNVGNGGYDALDYDIDLTWNATGVVSNYMTGTIPQASTTMTARAAAPLRSFSLDFEGMTVDSVLVNGAPATWTRDIDADAIKYKLIVTPATPVSGEFTVTVDYSGTPSRHVDADGSYEGWNPTADGAVLLGQPIGMMTGFPHNNTPSDKATYTISVDAPSEITSATGTGAAAVASNGELQSKTVSGDRTTWTWRQSRPMASELAVIDIGKFDVIEGSVTLTDGRVIPSWSFMDSALSAQNKTTITNRVAQLETITRNLESLFGPYPGGSTGVVVDTVPSGVNYALETQDRSFFPSTNSVAGNTLIHELVHQWYGNNVAPSTWTNIWMGEGMATWAPTFYNSTEGFGTNATPSEQTYFTSWNNMAETSPNWAIAPGGQTDSAELYSYQTYTRGAQFWAALKVAIGDEAFFTLIKQWQVDNTGQSRTGAELKALAEELSGIDLTAFWTDWILEPGKPAWPDKLSVALTGGSETALLPGDSVSYTVSATNTGRVALASSVVEIDLTELLANAELDALPEGATLDGTTLRWQVPAGTAVGTTVELTLSATILDSSPGGTFATTSRVVTVGGTCADCSVDTLVVEKLAPSELPVITGDAVVGETLTASSAGWPEGTELAYEWAIDGVPVETEEPVTEPAPALRAAALAANEFLIPADAEGSRITVTVTGTLEGFRDGSATSAPTDVVRAAEVPVDSDADADGSADAGGTDGSSDAGGTSGADGTSAAGGSSANGTGTSSGSGSGSGSGTGEQLSETGAELPIAAGLLALILLTAGGMFAAARRRSRIEA